MRLHARAQVEIDLANVGQGAYMPATYGKIITLRRQMFLNTETGTVQSHMFIINATTGVTVDQSKKGVSLADFGPLSKLCEALKIDVTNPIGIMDQDTSKKFVTCNADELYTNFMKSMSLYKTFQTLRDTSEKLADMKEHMSVTEEDVMNRQAAFSAVEQQWKSIEGLAQMEENAMLKENDILWASLRETEAKGKEWYDKVMESEARKAKLKAAEETVQQKIKEQQAVVEDKR